VFPLHHRPHSPELAPALVLLDRDGVVVVNERINIKRPGQLKLLPGAAEAIGRLTAAGVKVAICTNQPEIGRGVMSREQLADVHAALEARLAEHGGIVDFVLCGTGTAKDPWDKPGPGMLKAALARHGAVAAETPFVGDQLNDLRAAFHAGCRRVLVRTGLGAKTLAHGLPDYVQPVTVANDLAAAVDLFLGASLADGALAAAAGAS
jgi:D-glycero-D-manno-heptose 1,7-bisphosphate phosphatase